MNTKISLSLEDIVEESQAFFSTGEGLNSLKYELKFKSSWIYRDKCAVLDFVYKDVSFAFNLFSTGSAVTSVELLQRKSLTKFILNRNVKKYLLMSSNCSLDDALSKILVTCKTITFLIEDFYSTGKNHFFDEFKGEVFTPPLKIGVLTLPMNKNYGGNLQAYAMQEVLYKLGHEAIFINRRFPHPNAKNSSSMFSNTVGLSPSLDNKLFLDSNFRQITKPFFSSEQLAKDIGKYNLDGIIVGSDQVWRPKYANSILNDFFLGFIPENSTTKKLSYAASFGSDKWEYSEQEQELATNLLRQFDAIGVREDKGEEMCKEHLGTSSTHVLDPTMLLTAQHYSEKFKLGELRTDEDYLLNYVLDINKDKERTIHHLTSELGIEAQSVNGMPFEGVNALNTTSGDQSVEGWLAAFFKAKFIVTDSFHGVAFSILFNKQFLAYGNPARGMARFTSLLNMFGLSSRLVINSSQVTTDKLKSEIDWSEVNTKLQAARKHSINFLLTSLGLPVESIEKALISIGYPEEKKELLNKELEIEPPLPKKEKLLTRYKSKFVEIIPVREFPAKDKKNLFTIEKVVSSGLCIGCGACSYITSGKINISSNKYGLETVSEDGLKNLSEKELRDASAVCPFSDDSLNEDQLDAPYSGSRELPFNDVIGRYSSLFSGRQIGDHKVTGSSSGGLTSWLTQELLRKKMIDAVIHVGKSECNGDLFEYKISYTRGEINENRKSNYYPTTLTNILDKVKDNSNIRYAIVGVPCFIKATRLLAKVDKNLNRAFKYYIGLVCGHMKSKAFAESNAWQLGVAPNEIETVDFRKKMPNKKVGQYHFSVTSKTKRKFSAQPTNLIGGSWGHAFFQPNACNYCDDIFAETADIVFGDAWLPKYNNEWRGTNVVVSRNPKLTDLFNDAAHLKQIAIDDLSKEEVIQTQFGGISHRRHGLSVRIKDDELEGSCYPSKRINPSKINLPFWRVELFRQRRKMSQISSVVFYDAKEADNLEYFINKMREEIAVYNYIESIKNKKLW